TFDCSILSIRDGVFKVLSTNGDTRLGGDDFDHAIMAVVAADLKTDLAHRDPQLLQHLRDQAERTKIALSATESTEFVLDLLDRGIRYRRTFNRTEVEDLLRPFIDRTLDKSRSA